MTAQRKFPKNKDESKRHRPAKKRSVRTKMSGPRRLRKKARAKSQPSAVDTARRLLKEGHSVFPLGTANEIPPDWFIEQYKTEKNTLQEATEEAQARWPKSPRIKWKIYQTRLPTEKEFEDWVKRYLECNWALATGDKLVVIDADSAMGVAWMEPDAITQTPRRVRTSDAKKHYYFRPGSGVVIKTTGSKDKSLDIRAQRGYVVAAGSVHHSGDIYTTEGAQVPWEYLPELTADDLAAIEEFNGDTQRVTKKRTRISQHFTPTKLTPQLMRDLDSALNSLSSDNRDLWREMGQALHSLDPDSEELFHLWETWSRKSDKFREGECRRKWDGFSADGGLTHLTVFHRAIEEKWTPSPSAMINIRTSRMSEPKPSDEFTAPKPYPIDALPAVIRDAVKEVHDYVQAPLPLVACASLGVLSLAVQGHVNVRRDENLVGPVSLYILAIGLSGERKTTLDNIFAKPVRDYMARQAQMLEPEIRDYNADIVAWEAKQQGLKQKITQEAKQGKSTVDFEIELRELQDEKPESPKIPNMILVDETSENLGLRLTKEWPSASIITAEGGVVFGSYSLRKVESILGTLALYCVLWDGGTYSVGRKTSASYTLKDVRFTMSLQVQPGVLDKFVDTSGKLTRDSGFFARCLLAYPETTQGTRTYKKPEGTLAQGFYDRITEILQRELPFEEDEDGNRNGQLIPKELRFSKQGKTAWVDFYNKIEIALGPAGNYSDVSDIASKIAENAARLACLFAYFENPDATCIVSKHVKNAARIAEWHLDEARRFFRTTVVPEYVSDADKIVAWIAVQCRKTGEPRMLQRKVQQCGPVRDAKRFKRALKELFERVCVSEVLEGKKRFLKLDDDLLAENKV